MGDLRYVVFRFMLDTDCLTSLLTKCDRIGTSFFCKQKLKTFLNLLIIFDLIIFCFLNLILVFKSIFHQWNDISNFQLL